MNNSIKTSVVAALTLLSTELLASSTVFESKDILTPQEALGRYQWLQSCYPNLLVELADQILDPTTPRTGAQKQEALKQVLLYDNGNLKNDAKYITFGDENGDNPKRWYAGKSGASACLQIPSDYAVSALMVASSLPTYCAAQSRSKEFEYIKGVKIGKIDNTTGADFYSNFVGQAAKIYKDTTYQVTLTPGFADSETYPETWHVFVDWNRDGDFYDTDESHFAGVSQNPLTFALVPPAGTQPGLTKMRVTMDFLGGHRDACKEVDSGEVEDYLFYIK